MANQIVVSAGAKVRNLSGVLTATSGVVSFLPIDVSMGIPQLDVNGKILVSQLPNSVMEYKGTWNAATNTPTLANGTGNQGDVYLCNVAGTVDFGAGAIAFFVGDQVIYSGSIWQRASGATGTVTSVALTESGDSLNITGSPITTSGTINIGFNGTNLQYVNGAGNLTTFPILTGYVTAVSGTAPVVSSGGTTPAISMAAATGSVDGYLSATDFAIFSAKQSALTFSSPLVNTSGTISIPAATTSVNGYLASADFTTFNNKQNAITLTTTGTSGVATFVGATLNIPNYGSALTGYVPYTGATQDVDLGAFSLNGKSLHIKGTAGNGHLGLKHQSAAATGSANESLIYADSLGDLSWQNANLYLSKFITSANTANRSYTFPNATGTVPLTSDLTGYLTAVTATSPLSSSGGTTPNITIAQATTSANGYLSSTDWTTFNSKQGTITLTTTGTSGAATFTSNTLNIPNYGSALSGYLPLTGGTLTGVLNINLSSGTALNVAGNTIFRGDTGVGSPRQLLITSGGSTPVYLEAKGYGANYVTDFGIKVMDNAGTQYTSIYVTGGNGYVGINTVTPNRTFSVNGDINATDSTNNWDMVLRATSTESQIRSTYSGVGGFNPMTFYTSDTKQMTLTASGNLGLGVIPSAWESGYSVLQQNAKYFNAADGSANYQGINAYYNAGWKYIASGTAQYLQQYNGGFTFFNAASGTAGAAITWTNAMTLDSSGRLGIGTSTFNYASSGIGYLAINGSSANFLEFQYGTTNTSGWINGNSSTLNLYTSGPKDLLFGTVATERMRITSGGNVGIGTSSPTAISGFTSVCANNATTGAFFEAQQGGTVLTRFGGQSDIAFIDTVANIPFIIKTNSTERMRITSGGALCLGVTSAYGTNLLNVNGGIYATSSIAAVVAADIDMFVFSNTGASYSKSCIVASMVATGGTGSYFFYGQQSTSTVALKIFSNGNIQNTNNSYGAISDARLKENIIDATPKLDDLMKVKVRNYNLKGESNKQLGVISQELEAIFPNMIEESTNIGSDVKIKGVKYSVFVPMLIKAVQELKAEIEILKNK